MVSRREQMTTLLNSADTIVYLINRCAIYEALYLSGPGHAPPTENLASALQELYTAILRFLVEAVGLLESSSVKRTLHAFLQPGDVDKFRSNCQELEQRVDMEARNCESSSNSAMRQDVTHLQNLLGEISKTADAIYHTDKTVEALWHKATREERTEILTWICAIPYEDNHTFASEGRTENTGQWFLEHSHFKKWHASTCSMILWLHGKGMYLLT